ncbi:MAG: hypothetical protein R6T99_01365 [Bacteroidales bacterium]
MKLIKKLAILSFFALIIAFFSSSCTSGRQYCTDERVRYDRGNKIKAYTKNPHSQSFVHSKPIRKKWVLKK